MNLFTFPDPEDYKTFRRVLLDAGFTAAGVMKTLGIQGPPTIRENDIPVLLRRTRQGTPLDLLIRLFLIEVPIGLDALRNAILPMRPETLADAGLVGITDSLVNTKIK